MNDHTFPDNAEPGKPILQEGGVNYYRLVCDACDTIKVIKLPRNEYREWRCPNPHCRATYKQRPQQYGRKPYIERVGRGRS